MSDYLTRMLRRQQLEADQAKLLVREARLAEAEGRDSVFRRPTSPQPDYESLRGLPVVGSRSGTARAAAGVPTDRRPELRISINDVLNRYGNRCYLCGTKVTIVDLHLEHIIPRAHGGTDDPWNIAPACGPCNHRKGTRFVAFMVTTRKPIYLEAR